MRGYSALSQALRGGVLKTAQALMGAYHLAKKSLNFG